MLRTLFCLLLVCLPGSPALSQRVFTCGETTGTPAPPFVFDPYDESNDEPFSSQIIQYLITTGSAGGLQAAIIAMNEGGFPAITAEVVEADVTADSAADILTNITVSYGATFDEHLSLFTCGDEGYILLDTVSGGGWGGDRPDESPASIAFVEDMNDNRRPEIAIHATTIEGQKYHDSLYIYEWDGASLAWIFSTGPDYGAYREVRATNLDDDPATLELVIGYYYGYGQEAATAFIEITHVRPINMLYEWAGTRLTLTCRYFTDEPETLFETLHSAETSRVCGHEQDALAAYERLFTDNSLQAWAEADWWSLPWIIFPESVEDQTAYAADLERAYLRAFAGYRLTQLDLALGDRPSAEEVVNQLTDDYHAGEHGYVYAAMAIAYWEVYEESGQYEDACAAAETVFHTTYENGDDPHIAYYEDIVGEDIVHYGFYFYSGFRYSPDPDNLFSVPEDINGILDIPYCL